MRAREWLLGGPIAIAFIAVPFLVTSYWLGRLLVAVAGLVGRRPHVETCFLAVLAIEVSAVAICAVRASRSNRKAGCP